MQKETWGSKIGFILAATGSAVGLANIWRFPYMVGENGGGAFILVYLLCLALVGIPLFIAEVWIGRKCEAGPPRAFQILGGNLFSRSLGFMTVLTGFLVSSFYSVVAGWVLGYLIEAIRGALQFSQPLEAANHFNCLLAHPFWGLGFHLAFMLLSTFILFFGVRSGIERANKIGMPLLLTILLFLVFRGITLDTNGRGLYFLLKPDLAELTPFAFLAALGHSFFTLSLGQGTMVTYGSYMKKEMGLISSAIPVVMMDTVISLLSAVAIFTLAFAEGIEPDSGPSLIFQTLPRIFSDIPFGMGLAAAFFFMVTLAALTSQISALEPMIAYLTGERGWNRHPATIIVAIFSFLLGVPSALSASLHFKPSFLEAMDFLCNALLIPLGGLAAVLLLAWRSKQLSLWIKEEGLSPLVRNYLFFTLRFSAPILIIVIFLHALGLFS